MGYSRRAFGASLLAGLAGTAGCLGFVRGEEPLTFTAVGAEPSDEALEETGYRHHRTETEPITETIDVGGTTREVELVNVLVECDRAVDLGPIGRERAAAFVVFASPTFDVAGRSFHPGDRISPRRLATELAANYDGLTIGDEVDERTLTVFEEAVDVTTFEGRGALGPTSLDVHVHLGTATNDEDFVILVGVHPRRFEGEREHVATLAESLSAMAN